jgi:hypothetical protein
MAESKKSDIKEAEDMGVPAVQSITESTPAEADKSPLPNAMDAKPEDPPVRASKPDTPIAQVLAAGAGAHTPPDPEEYDPEGRPWGARKDERKAYLASLKEDGA